MVKKNDFCQILPFSPLLGPEQCSGMSVPMLQIATVYLKHSQTYLQVTAENLGRMVGKSPQTLLVDFPIWSMFPTF